MSAKVMIAAIAALILTITFLWWKTESDLTASLYIEARAKLEALRDSVSSLDIETIECFPDGPADVFMRNVKTATLQPTIEAKVAAEKALSRMSSQDPRRQEITSLQLSAESAVSAVILGCQQAEGEYLGVHLR